MRTKLCFPYINVLLFSELQKKIPKEKNYEKKETKWLLIFMHLLIFKIYNSVSTVQYRNKFFSEKKNM